MITSIRCPNHRPHNKYDLCGRLLGAIDGARLFLYCEDCKNFFEVRVKENNNVEMIPLPKKEKLTLKTGLRVILNDS